MKFPPSSFSAFFFLFALLVAGCADSKPETLFTDGYDQAEMDAAIEQARENVDLFIAAMQAGDGTDFAIKEPITDKNETEHFWLTDVTYADGQFKGLVGNDPGIVKNVKFGDERIVKKEAISDWLYFKDGKMRGNYTLPVLLKSASPEERAEYESMMGE